MIPIHEMTKEDFYLTFPDWVPRRDVPTIWPHDSRTPGLDREQREKMLQEEHA